jgi:hypothetical protein
MSYYNRPLLVKNALESILLSNEYHQDWRLVFADDGSKEPGRPIVNDILQDHLNKITFIETGLDFSDKIKNGLILGKLANESIKKSDADVAIILCDDDKLATDYLANLSNFFVHNKQILYCYSKLHIYNPLIQQSDVVTNHKWNNFNEPICPVNNLDASQVAWRLDCCKKYGAWFNSSTKEATSDKPWVKDTDKSFFENLYNKCGLCYPTGFFGQYKGIHDYQLVWHKNVHASKLYSYNEICEKWGGIKF